MTGKTKEVSCLNPYCSGQWSRTLEKAVDRVKQDVLILIVVDNGLVLLVELNKARKALS